MVHPEALAVNQASSGNRPHRAAPGTRIWIARGVRSAQYLALFNTQDSPASIQFDLSRLKSGAFLYRSTG